jgi:hypothetical protein
MNPHGRPLARRSKSRILKSLETSLVVMHRFVTRCAYSRRSVVETRTCCPSSLQIKGSVPSRSRSKKTVSKPRHDIAGTHKAIRRAYVGRYFAEFQFRFNGRHDLPAPFTNLLAAATSARPRTHADIRLA